jgi:hypothetical protein
MHRRRALRRLRRVRTSRGVKIYCSLAVPFTLKASAKEAKACFNVKRFQNRKTVHKQDIKNLTPKLS